MHGFLLMDGEKMSKSLGNVLDPFAVMEQFGTDALRFYCFREVSFGQDGSVSTAGFEARYESELANDYGNLASRTLAMIARYRDGRVPEAARDPALAASFDGLAAEVEALLDRTSSARRSRRSGSACGASTSYVEERAPWQLAKDPAQADALDVTLASLAEGLRIVTVLLHPYMPSSTTKLLAALGRRERAYDTALSGGAGWREPVAKIEPLFPKHR